VSYYESLGAFMRRLTQMLKRLIANYFMITS
jgi:hypothetical protein